MVSQKPSLISKISLLALVFGLAVPALADQIVMKNGDRVTGAVVKDGNALTVKTDQFGAVSLAWDQIASITTDKPVNVVLANGQALKAPLTTSGAMISIGGSNAAPADVKIIRDDAEQAAFDRVQHPNWGQSWAGTGNLGLAGTAGNAQALTFTMGLNAARTTNTDKTALYFNAIKASALADGKDSDTAKAIRGGWAYSHNVAPKLFVGVFNDYEYDKFQNLDLRFVIGGNLGYHVWKTMRSQLDALAGFDYNHASYFNPDATTSFAEFMFGDDYNLKINGTTSVVQSVRFFDSMADTSAYRVNADLGASTKIAKWFTWNITLSDRYNAKPAIGRKTNDFLYSTGIGVTFAHYADGCAIRLERRRVVSQHGFAHDLEGRIALAQKTVVKLLKENLDPRVLR